MTMESKDVCPLTRYVLMVEYSARGAGPRSGIETPPCRVIFPRVHVAMSSEMAHLLACPPLPIPIIRENPC